MHSVHENGKESQKKKVSPLLSPKETRNDNSQKVSHSLSLDIQWFCTAMRRHWNESLVLQIWSRKRVKKR